MKASIYGLVILFFISYNSSPNNECKLEVTKDSLVFQLNPQTLVYDMNTREYINTITLEKEGPNGVGLFCGYTIYSWNEIYIPCMMKNEIDIVDSTGLISRKIPYSTTIQGKQTLPFIVTAFLSYV